MSGINGRAAKLLGQTTEVVIRELAIAPQLFITVEDTAGVLPLNGKCLRVLDSLAGKAIFSPITPQSARAIAGTLLQYADSETTGGDHDGSASVHEQ